MTAPAEMPGVEEIARAIASWRHRSTPANPYPPSILPSEMAQASAVMALFAPILAEKERRIANLTRGLEESAETSVKVGMTWQSAAEKAEARALAAEAALAAERKKGA